MREKILITGSCGFIASNLIRKLLYDSNQYSITSIDRVDENFTVNNIYNNKSHLFHIGNINDKHLLNIVFKSEKPDIVIHCASADSDDSIDVVESNVTGTQSIINACKDHGVGKLVYLSTYKVYGPSGGNPNEDAVADPRTLYATTKLAGENLVRISRLSYSILRLSNVFGQRQTPNKLIPKIIKSVLNNQSVELYSGGSQTRDWLYITDACNAIIKSMNECGTYNVCSGFEMTSLEMFQQICNALDGGHNLISFSNGPIDNDDIFTAHSGEFRKLGWKTEVKFKDSLQETVKWYINNQWFLKGFNNG